MTPNFFGARQPHRGAVALSMTVLLLAGCENLPDALKPAPVDDDGPVALAGGSLTLEERDVEAPEVFNVIDDALWDGRPSFGGVWVAYPGNTQPERVNIRNVANGKSVVGALFKREAANPGPKIAMSSDAAEALGVLAGTPTKLTITALRREPIEVTTAGSEVAAPEVLSETVLEPVGETAGPAPNGVDAQSVEDVAVTVKDALKDIQAPEATLAPEPKPVAAAAVASSAPAKPYIQVGTFSSESNANDLVAKLAAADVPAEARASTSSSGKTLYKVVAGPAASADQLSLFSSKIGDLGFKDAFPVSK